MGEGWGSGRFGGGGRRVEGWKGGGGGSIGTSAHGGGSGEG